MTSENQPRATRALSVFVAMTLLLSGCGGGSGGSDSGTACDDLGPFAIFTGGLCLLGPSSSQSSGPSPGPTPSPGSRTTRAVSSLEVEPNNELSTATVVTMESHGGYSGFETTGSVNGQTDPIDTYVLTLGQRRGIEVRLCAIRDPDCLHGPITQSTLYVEVADALGNTVSTLQSRQEFLKVTIDGGLPYYVRVVAPPRISETLGYYLRTALIDPADVPDATDPAEPEIAQPSAPELWISSASDLTVTLDWLPPTDYTDGSPLTNISHYHVQMGQSPSGMYTLDSRPPAGVSSSMLTLPEPGTWYFAIAAVDGSGLEGELSNQVSASLPEGPP